MRVETIKEEDYPKLSDQAGKWLSLPWLPKGLRPVEGLYIKPHLYYA